MATRYQVKKAIRSLEAARHIPDQIQGFGIVKDDGEFALAVYVDKIDVPLSTSKPVAEDSDELALEDADKEDEAADARTSATDDDCSEESADASPENDASSDEKSEENEDEDATRPLLSLEYPESLKVKYHKSDVDVPVRYIETGSFSVGFD